MRAYHSAPQLYLHPSLQTYGTYVSPIRHPAAVLSWLHSLARQRAITRLDTYIFLQRPLTRALSLEKRYPASHLPLLLVSSINRHPISSSLVNCFLLSVTQSEHQVVDELQLFLSDILRNKLHGTDYGLSVHHLQLTRRRFPLVPRHPSRDLQLPYFPHH